MRRSGTHLPYLEQTLRALAAAEPEAGLTQLAFSHVLPPRRRFTLWGFLRPQRAALVLGVVLVALETIALQAGPLLTPTRDRPRRGAVRRP